MEKTLIEMEIAAVPSGLLNSLKVGSEMAVCEMERMGLSMQEMSLGWQDFTHRMMSARSTLGLLEEDNTSV